MTLRRTFQWLIVLVLFSALGLGGYAWWIWEQRDILLQATIREKLPEVLPGWNVRIGRVQFDWYRRVRIRDVVLLTADPEEQLVSLPELVVTVDRQSLTQSQQVVIQKVRLVGPVVDVVRDASGRWNWQGLPPLKKTDKALPDFEIDQGTVRVRFESRRGAVPTTITLRHVDMKLVPSGKRAYIVKGATHVNEAGNLALEGRFDLDTKTWSLGGRIRDVQTSGELLSIAAGVSPELRARLVRIEQSLQQLKAKVETADAEDLDGDPDIHFASGKGVTAAPPIVVGEHTPLNAGHGIERDGVPARIAVFAPDVPSAPAVMPPSPAEEPELLAAPDDYVPNLGVSGTLDVGFQVDQFEAGVPPDFRLAIGLRDGKVTNSILPFPLFDIDGDFTWDNRHLDLKRLSAHNGNSKIVFGGRIDRRDGAAPGRFTVRLEDIPVDERVRGRLPPSLRRLYDSLQPSGVVDIDFSVVYDGVSRWKAQDFVLACKTGAVSHVKFPYRVTDVVGTVTQKGKELELLFEGRAGMRPVLLQGVVKNPGPENEVLIDIFVRQLPLDETLLTACPTPVQAPIRTLNLRGLGDGEVRLYRPPGIGQKMQLSIAAKVSRGTFEYLHFPYRLTNLTGKVNYNSVDELWTFRELTALHGTARITGEGSFSRITPPGRLDLAIRAENAPFDQQLNLALPDSLRKIWDDVSPAGRIKSLSTTIRWQPGQKADIRLPEIEVADGSLLLKAFPYLMEDVESKMSWEENRLRIDSFQARHEDTEIRAVGAIDTHPAGDWRMRLTKVSADDLIPDRTFRKALPKSLKNVVDQIDPIGPVSVSGFLELRGTEDPRDPVTAAWDIESVLAGSTLNAGVVLRNVHGRVTSRGSYDGAIAEFGGMLDLDSLVALDHQFTQVKGPWRLRDTQLIVGSADAMLPDRRPANTRAVPASERVTARFVGGVVTLDAAAAFNETPVYDAKIAMHQGKLEEYAARYLSGAHNLRGTMTGWVDLHGTGSSAQGLTGRGKLQISPAAIYESPVLVQVFRTISFTPPDRTAFHYAYTDFQIARQQFTFSTIDLVGDAINLRGHGSAGFDGRLNIDFYSMMPKNRLANIPVLNFVVGEATKGWVGVEVRGTMSNPQAHVKAVPQLDDAMKRFLGAFDPRQTAPLPLRPNIPGLTGY